MEIAAHRFRGRLAARLGLPPTAPTEQLCRDCRLRLGWSDRGLFDTLRDCDRAVIDPGLDEWRAFQLVQALHGYTVALGLATPPPRGKG